MTGPRLPPALSFAIGACGHRALPDADLAGLRAEAARLFGAVRAELMRRHARDQGAAAPPALRCLCGLAEGADALLAAAALAEGWKLEAILPFARQEFERDFTAQPALEEFRRLLGLAACRGELNGSRAAGAQPYVEVGERILARSNLILAIWDGLPPRGPGGTGDVVRQALDRGIPVAVLPPSGPAVLEWRGMRSSDLTGILDDALLRQAERGGQA